MKPIQKDVFKNKSVPDIYKLKELSWLGQNVRHNNVTEAYKGDRMLCV
jgi:hypothetical protein